MVSAPWGGRSKQSSFEMMIEDAVENALRRNGVLDRPTIDGRITRNDVTQAAWFGGGIFASGLIVSSGLTLLFSADPEWAVRGTLVSFSLGGLSGGALVVIDYVIPRLPVVREFNEFRKERDEYRAWKRERRAAQEPREVEHVVTVQTRDRGHFRFLRFDADQSRRAVAFARRYLDLVRDGNDYPTAEKYYIGSGNIWSNASTGDAGRPGWDAFKEGLVSTGLAYREDNNRWHLLAAGTAAMERILTEWEERE